MAAAAVARSRDSPALGGSRSSPTLGLQRSSHRTQATPTLPHRGAHDVGHVEGLKGNLYVPRAVWVESLDSPMKQRNPDFDPRLFLEAEVQRQRQQDKLKRYLRKEMSRQVEDFIQRRQEGEGHKQEMARTLTSDATQVADNEKRDQEAALEARRRFRQGLDQQAAENARRTQEELLRQTREAAEMKLQTVQALAKEMAEQARRKKAAKAEFASHLQNQEAREKELKAEKQREMEELRQRMLKQAEEDERRTRQQRERLEAAQARQEVACKYWSETAGKESTLRATREERREDRDERRHLKAADAFYTKREEARKRQQREMVQGLDNQLSVSSGKKQLEQMQKRSDLEAVLRDTRLALEQEIEAVRSKKVGELELQVALVQQMAEKQRRAEKEGYRPPAALSTMTVTQSMLASVASRSPLGGSTCGKTGGFANLTQRMDASKYLDKPLGREVSRDDAKRWGLGSSGQLLAKTAQLAEQDRKLSSNWTEGLSPAKLREGSRAAAKRAAAALADKSDA